MLAFEDECTSLRRAAALWMRDNWYSTTVAPRLFSVTVEQKICWPGDCLLEKGAENQAITAQHRSSVSEARHSIQ
jgi:hypothetical protein